MISNFFDIKYSLKIFKEYNLTYSWYTIFVGRDLGVLSIQEIINYSRDYLSENTGDRNRYIWELAFENIYNMDYLLDQIFTSLKIEKNSKDWNREWIKWRYCVLNYWKDVIKDTEELINTLD